MLKRKLQIGKAKTGYFITISSFRLSRSTVHIDGFLTISAAIWTSGARSFRHFERRPGRCQRKVRKVWSLTLCQFEMEKMKELADTNLLKAQEQQKVWYDRNTRKREFQCNDMVLLLLPTSANKLLAK